ncbi:hypothetical protein LPJ64_002456 [Coemansia asiatica]|uniref:Phosphatidic acid phosphatase type 2/haloperoxidase domain-containing protein n=1 Tax=Coemansia asiatica TaxID=1052880 RepID=A0A9W8CJP7_9FUNG|nr:hypothetical protein LPJ64_002456 [Coemansia asiatica]
MARAHPAWNRTLAFFDMSREIVITSAAVALLYYRSSLQIHMLLGSVLCCSLAKVLKLLIRQERPAKETHGKTSFGMPSTHSAAVIYFGTYLACLVHPQRHCPSADLGSSLIARWSLLILILPTCTMAALSRAFNGYHTFKQVFAGMCLGAAFAGMWWSIRHKMYPYIDPLAEIVQLHVKFQPPFQIQHHEL